MTNLFQVCNNELLPIQRTKLQSEDQVEGWLAKDPRRIGLDVLIIGRQVTTAFNGRIDLLGLGRDGSLTIIELKRDRTPREIVAQVLDYASWVRKLTSREIHEIATAYLKKSLGEVFEEYFGEPLAEDLNAAHSMVIVASEFDDSSRRIVEYLSEEYGVNINTAFFNIFEYKGEMLLATDWLVDQEQVVENARIRKDYPWSGWWYVNAGQEERMRSWTDMRRYGFLAAGGGAKYSRPLGKLKPGETVFAYQKQRGYVGYGTVTSEAVAAREYRVNGTPFSSLQLHEPGILHDAGNPELEEWVVGVEWKKTFDLSEAKSFSGVFANQNIVCRLTHPATIEFLKQVFVPIPNDSEVVNDERAGAAAEAMA